MWHDLVSLYFTPYLLDHVVATASYYVVFGV